MLITKFVFECSKFRKNSRRIVLTVIHTFSTFGAVIEPCADPEGSVKGGRTLTTFIFYLIF